MAEVYISLSEAAELENIKYNTLVQQIKRNPEKFQLRKEQRTDGGKDLSMIALSSLSKKAVAAYKERQKLAEVPAVSGMEEVAVSGESEVPWYVNEDVDYFMEPNGIRQWNWEILSGSFSTTTAQGGQNLPNTSHRSGLEKESGRYTGTQRVIWKPQHGRISSTRKMAEIMNFTKSCACAESRRKPEHFQASQQR
jgi:hypothetical protein